MLIDYYVDLFTSSNPHNLESILDGIQEVVTWEMNSNLTAPYTADRAGSRPRQVRPRPKALLKDKIFLKKKAPFFIVKGPNFYKIIYIF